MKLKISCLILSAVLLLPSLFVSVSANNERFSWYCKRTKDHSQPPLPSEFNFICDYNGFYIDDNSNEKIVYLTFDAGYENGNVGKTLDILKSNQVPGAFFILDNLIETSPDIVKRMANEGHTVCNHTSTHKDVSIINNFDIQINL